MVTDFVDLVLWLLDREVGWPLGGADNRSDSSHLHVRHMHVTCATCHLYAPRETLFTRSNLRNIKLFWSCFQRRRWGERRRLPGRDWRPWLRLEVLTWPPPPPRRARSDNHSPPRPSHIPRKYTHHPNHRLGLFGSLNSGYFFVRRAFSPFWTIFGAPFPFTQKFENIFSNPTHPLFLSKKRVHRHTKNSAQNDERFSIFNRSL